MYKFTNLTKVNGINYKNLESARQNQYCWSMSELGDYIYVGTSRNMVPEILKISLEKILNSQHLQIQVTQTIELKFGDTKKMAQVIGKRYLKLIMKMNMDLDIW